MESAFKEEHHSVQNEDNNNDSVIEIVNVSSPSVVVDVDNTSNSIRIDEKNNVSESDTDSDSDSDSVFVVKSKENNQSEVVTSKSVQNENKKLKSTENEGCTQESSNSSTQPANSSTKRSYDDMSYDKDDSDQMCPICLEMWTSDGEHRLCSLKCGHLFGKSCIFNWLVKQKKHFCPQCNKSANSRDIRELFATKLIALDYSLKMQLERRIEMVKEEKRQVEIELEKCRLYTENYKQELSKLQNELAKITGKTENIVSNKAFKFKLEKTIKILNGCCRVCVYNQSCEALIVGHQSNNPLFPGFGVKKILNIGSDYVGNNFMLLHTKTIRDIKFHPISSNLILSVGFDKCAKISDLQIKSVIHTFVADYALWSCCWDEEDSNFIYVGTGKGTVLLYDIRSPNAPITDLKLTGDTSSVVSLCYISPKSSNVSRGGVLCCRLNSVVFYQKNTGHEYNLIRFHTLTGPFFSLIHDPTTNHILVSCRPSSSISHVRHLYCQLNGEQCLPIHVFIGGTVQSMLSRPCFFKLNDQSLIAVFQQSNNSIELWNASTGSKVSIFQVNEEIYDVTSITSGERIFIVTVGSSSIKFYELL
ncbi:conserved hypothetical protein [Pediculus humanus corporis]|uniref:RING-type E3 ubiquitin transferase n=1 Tax=Pediculus humanus subsp. corporis TaxID=121224 RepID=E0VT05_PEDHC|nr:uncharacterized protein Phum_PHUM424870 [Pediculus humanus corporis]EEB16511.1 conserved hypothetical protein [Pediculus humanus corporis]